MVAEKHPGNGPAEYFVSPDMFFSTDVEKTKLNWFLFEFAQETEAFIRREKRVKRQLRRKKVGDSRIDDFCVHYTMSPKILLTARKKSSGLEVNHLNNSDLHFSPYSVISSGHEDCDNELKAPEAVRC